MITPKLGILYVKDLSGNQIKQFIFRWQQWVQELVVCAGILSKKINPKIFFFILFDLASKHVWKTYFRQ